MLDRLVVIYLSDSCLFVSSLNLNLPVPNNSGYVITVPGVQVSLEILISEKNTSSNNYVSANARTCLLAHKIIQLSIFLRTSIWAILTKVPKFQPWKVELVYSFPQKTILTCLFGMYNQHLIARHDRITS